MKLLTTRMDQAQENYIARLERMAEEAEVARDYCAADLKILTDDAVALRATVAILLEVDYSLICVQCGMPRSEESVRFCRPCDEGHARARAKVRARLRVA